MPSDIASYNCQNGSQIARRFCSEAFVLPRCQITDGLSSAMQISIVPYFVSQVDQATVVESANVVLIEHCYLACIERVIASRNFELSVLDQAGQ